MRAAGPHQKSERFAFMNRFEVPNLDDPTETYLTRWRVVQTPWFALYVHRFDGPDSRFVLHDHPWNFMSIVLRGGYTEMRLNKLDRTVGEHTVKHINVVRRDDAHYITKLLRYPSWSLLLVGGRKRTWGYWEPSSPSVCQAIGNEFAWVWTEFDKHRFGLEFDAAMANRKEQA
jgi:hypothetical protein